MLNGFSGSNVEHMELLYFEIVRVSVDRTLHSIYDMLHQYIVKNSSIL